MDIACMVILVDINRLMRFVWMRTVQFFNVKEDTLEFVIIIENTRDVNLQPSADINMRIWTMKMKKLTKLKLD